jgi:hypothetical protein
MKVGGEYLLGTGATLSNTLASSGKRGAYLLDKAGAKAAGERVLVCFR